MIVDLSGKIAFVAGSTQGIGWASALQLANSGCTVVLVARNEAKLKERVLELPTAKGQQHDYIVADLTDTNGLKTKMEKYVSEKSGGHILVNNAGGPPPGQAHTANTNEYLNAFHMHLLANQVMAQALVPFMKKEGYGRIINVISTSVKQPLANLGVSNTIRGAVANWSKTLANELASFGITVNNVLPGATATSRLDGIIQNKAQKGGISLDEASVQMTNQIPAKRFAQPEELAYAICFLSSDLAAYINGINVPVDGGRTGCL